MSRKRQRQVVLYDKRAEVIATGKAYWWPIWDAALTAQGLPPLDPKDRAESSVWRVEIRAYKRHLKDKWGVTTWGDLRERLPEILHYALCDVRYTVPTGDSNRARWPDHPIWSVAHDGFTQDMEGLQSMVDRADIDALLLARSDDALLRQITSCLISRAALFGIQEDRLYNFAEGTIHQLTRDWSGDRSRIREKLAQARSRYGAVVE